MARTSAPLPVYTRAVRDRLGSAGIARRFRPQRAAFEAMLGERDFTTDWFTSRLSEWLAIFERHPLPADADILEIGSWEGMSTLFLLSTWPGVRMTCVDTWRGGVDFLGTRQGDECEGRFDANTASYADRITKFRGSSAEYFAAAPQRGRFDFIYVDGSHSYADVLGDAFAAFEALKPGGLMIFDDYLMAPLDGVADCPAPAINQLLRDKRGHYELVAVDWQLALRKRADR